MGGFKRRGYRSVIERAADSVNVSPHLLCAIIMQESSGDPTAMRFEPGYYEDKLKTKPARDLKGFVPMQVNHPRHAGSWMVFEKQQRATSFGLMQILGDTARSELGVDGVYLAWELLRPEVNIELGARYFGLCLKRAKGSVKRALWLYNGSQGYVDPVLEKMELGVGKWLLEEAE